jgi:hypothetical protein
VDHQDYGRDGAGDGALVRVQVRGNEKDGWSSASVISSTIHSI